MDMQDVLPDAGVSEPASKSLAQLLTIVVTTSPIKSNPSTELLERTFSTFDLAGPEFAYECPKVIVCDGCRVLDDDEAGDCSDSCPTARKVSRRHAKVKQALRNGIATREHAERYAAFKAALRTLCTEADAANTCRGPECKHSASTAGPAARRSAFCHTTVVELEERHGYGFALRHALRFNVQTPFVCVVQHDRTFLRRAPMAEIVQAMRKDGDLKYVGLSMRSNLAYRDVFAARHGRAAAEELMAMVRRPRELALDAGLYGPEGAGGAQKSTAAGARGYRGSAQSAGHAAWRAGLSEERAEVLAGRQQLALTPTVFWYDNTHVCDSAHYRDFIFNPANKLVAQGGFVEDKLSPAIKRSVAEKGLRGGHARFGCFLLDDDSGVPFTGHLDGGAYLTAQQRASARQGRGQGCDSGAAAAAGCHLLNNNTDPAVSAGSV